MSQEVYDPASPRYRKFLSAVEVSDRFGPTKTSYESVRSYFERRGFHIVSDSPNRMTFTMTGTRALAEHVLDVDIRDYVAGHRHFRANDKAPRLPTALAGRVAAIVGLSDLAKPAPTLDHIPNNQFGRGLWYALCANYAVNGGISGGIGGAEATFTLMDSIAFAEIIATLNILNSLVNIAFASDLSDSGTGQTYAKCVNMYNKKWGYGTIGRGDPPPPAWQGVDGTGQTVGLLEFDTFDPADVSDYAQFMGRASGPASNVSEVHVNGGATPGNDQDEVLLDIDAALTGAPGAKIIVFDAPFTGPGTSFQQAFNAMINYPGVSIISNSWAYCEDQTTLADVQSIDSILQTAAASGISVLTGAGDRGSTCLDGSSNTAHVPATSPHVTAVGGTSLVLNPGFAYGSETWWDGSKDTPPTGQGGFGVSRFFGRPSYQDGFNSSAMRSIPDVSADADPRFGLMICQASAGGCPTGQLYGGTSGAAPAWAAFTALFNQAQGSNLGFLNPLVYPLGNTDAFHNGPSMGSDFAHVGLGSPNLARLHQYLSGQSTGAVDPAVSSAQAVLQTSFVPPQGASAALPAYADGTTQVFVVVRLADANGNPVGGKTVAVTPGSGSHAVIQPPSAVSGSDDGVANFIVTDTTTETITLRVSDVSDSIDLADMPKVGFAYPPAAGGSIVASPTDVINNGTSSSTVTVSLRDALGRPSPGKLIQLSQGSGRSVITAPNPSVTDANGQIQFTATDLFDETVTYSAVDATDGDVPVPGTAAVTFAGSANLSCVGNPPTAATGYTLAAFANGFTTRNLFFGNVNWGCSGVSNPTFSTSGSVYAANFATGDLFRFPAAGGAVSSGNTLANLGLTLGQPTFGKDGRLYATHGATTGDFTTGNIVEIDPQTGAQLRVLASNLTCPNGLAVDPLSGDLFFDDACTGAGSDNPSLFRIRNPGDPSPRTVEVYADLLTSPNGAISFAPDGTIYVVTQYYGNVNAPILQVAGTDKLSPPVISTLTGVTTNYWLTVGAAQPDGSAKSLIVLAPTGLSLVDLTTNPPTSKPLTVGGIGSGVIGPDGCLYATATDTIYNLAPSTGACEFASTNPAPALSLSPLTVSPEPAQGDTVTFTATLRHVATPAGTPVYFQVNGANPQIKLVPSDANGQATYSYPGVLAGQDTVVATAAAGDATLKSNQGEVTWLAGQHATFLSLNDSPRGGIIDQPTRPSASLIDISVFPYVPLESEPVHFDLDGEVCDSVTDPNGIATCGITPPSEGMVSLAASFDGTNEYGASQDSVGFNVLGAPAPSNQPPVANAGPNQTDRQGSLVMLTGSASYDPDNAPSVLTYSWTQMSGPSANLSDAHAVAPTFTAVSAGAYVFQLIVNDGAADSSPSSATIRVPLLGDVNLDGDVDSDDVRLVMGALNKPADGPNDLRDINGDMRINVLDARQDALLCTRPNCAVH